MTTETQIRTSNTKISEALELLNEAAKEKRDELKGLMTDKYAHIREAVAAGAGQAKEMAGDVDKRVHKDPWVYIAGAAAASLIFGYLMGSKRK